MSTREEWEELLVNLQQPNTEVVKAAAKRLNVELKDKRCVLFLMQALHDSPKIGVKQAAAVLLRKRIGGHWESLEAGVKQNIQVAVLSILRADAEAVPRFLRRPVADLASKIGLSLLPTNSWPELWVFLAEGIGSPTPVHREMVLQVFEDLIIDESVWTSGLSEKIGDVYSMISAGMQDADNHVRVAALRCALVMISKRRQENFPELRKRLVQEWVPMVVEIMKYFIAHGDDDVAQAFEVIERLLEQEFEFMSPFVPNLMGLMLEIAADEDTELNIRQKALYVVEFVITYRPKTYLACNVTDKTLSVVYRMCTDQVGEEEEDSERWQFGVKIIDSIALHIPAKFGFEKLSSSANGLMRSADIFERKLGVAILGFMAEGYADQLADNMENVLMVVVNAFKDPDNRVRESALFAIGEMSTHIVWEMRKFHGVVIPLLLSACADPLDTIKIKALSAIRYSAESLQDDIEIYLEQIVATCITAVSNPDPEVVEIALGALAACISSAGIRSGPAVTRVMPILMNIMGSSDAEHIFLRTHATECLAAIVEAIGKDIGPHFEPILAAVMRNFEIKDYDLHTYTFFFIEAACKTFGADLAGHLDQLAIATIASCGSSDGIIFVTDDQLDAVIEDDETDNVVDRAKSVQVDIAFCEVKCAAVYALGWMAAEVGRPFQKYLEESIFLLTQLVEWVDESVRAAAATAMVQVLTCAKEVLAPNYVYEDGVPAAQQMPPAELIDCIYGLVGKLLERLEVEDVASVTKSLLDACTNVALHFGPAAVEPFLEGLTGEYLKLLNRQGASQVVRESFEEEDEEDLAVFTSLLAGVVSYSRVLGKQVLPMLEHILPALVPYISKDAPGSYLHIGIGEVAEMAEVLQGTFEPYAPAMMPFALDGLQSECKMTQSNAAFAVGHLFVAGGVSVAKFYQQAVGLLGALLAQDESKAARDNAVGALSRLIANNPNINLPFDSLLPALLACLPLARDHEPAEVTYTSMLLMLRNGHPEYMKRLHEIIALFCREVCQERDLPEHTRAEMINMVKEFGASHQQDLTNIVNGLASQSLLSAEELQQLQGWLS